MIPAARCLSPLLPSARSQRQCHTELFLPAQEQLASRPLSQFVGSFWRRRFPPLLPFALSSCPFWGSGLKTALFAVLSVRLLLGLQHDLFLPIPAARKRAQALTRLLCQSASWLSDLVAAAARLSGDIRHRKCNFSSIDSVLQRAELLSRADERRPRKSPRRRQLCAGAAGVVSAGDLSACLA